MTDLSRGSNKTATASALGAQDRINRRGYVFWRTVLLVALIDVGTKEWARHQILPEHMPRALVGDVLRLTLVYNPGAAFGLYVGPHSRWIFMILTVTAIAIMARIYRSTPANDGIRALSLGLVMGGALGNLISRIWSPRGVVDFIDVGIGHMRWPAFNVADIGVSVGAALLAWSLWSDRTPSMRPKSPP